MNNNYPFKLGHFACVAISDGGLNYPVESFFKGVDVEQAQAVLKDAYLPTTHIYTPYTLLFIDTGAHKVLIDMGIGQSVTAARKMFPTVDNSMTPCGILLQNMRDAGLDPHEIDTVIITHAHPDHVGGAIDAEGRLNFPNARYFIWKDEWEFWFSDERAGKTAPAFVTIARTYLEPLRERVTLVDSEDDIVSGISPISTPGHTPGHICVRVASDTQVLFHLSDALIHPLHLEHPEIVPVFDLMPEQAQASKTSICNRAAEEKALVFAHHFPPFPNLGFIVRQGDGWQWQPLVEGELGRP
jgi:glyoxylase-like metal-dependent hydrolase (beta-lactamase superfamily II)